MLQKNVVLLSCGSFNPITNMHLRMFELARDYLHSTEQYRVVGGIISPVNDAYGKDGLEASIHRCAMVDLALRSSDWVRLDTWEVEQDHWSTTLSVLEHFQRRFDASVDANRNIDNSATASSTGPSYSRPVGKRARFDDEITNGNVDSRCHVMLLCGADLLESFAVPGLWNEAHIERIVSQFGLVVITREGSNPARFVYESDILSRHAQRIHIVTEWITNEISSTRVRRALRRGESVKYLLFDDVIRYIKEHSLYHTPPSTSKLKNESQRPS